MTEEEWTISPNLGKMLFHLSEGNERKLRLFALSCCQRVRHLVEPDLFDNAMGALAEYVEGKRPITALASVQPSLLEALNRVQEDSPREEGVQVLTAPFSAINAVLAAVSSDYRPRFNSAGYTSAMSSLVHFAASVRATPIWDATRDREMTDRARRGEEDDYLRWLCDIFGNPFRPIAFDPAWGTEATVGLARGIYDDCAFERMPILADALEEAGCEHADILAHCREPGVHVRGCWVVDLVLGMGELRTIPDHAPYRSGTDDTLG